MVILPETLRRRHVRIHRNVSLVIKVHMKDFPCVYASPTSICICGGGPSSGMYHEYIGGRYWHNPGAFASGFKGVCTVFVFAAFSFCKFLLVIEDFSSDAEM